MPEPERQADPSSPSGRSGRREATARRRKAVARRREAVDTALGVAFGTAVWLRLGGLRESLWYDEIAAFRDHASRGLGALATWGDPANHLLQSALSWLSLGALGGLLGEEVALRLPSLLASLALVWWAPWIARTWARPGGGPGERDALGVLFALAAAAAPVLVLAGTEARGYPFMVLGAALGLAGLDRAVARGWADPVGRRGAIVAVAAFTAGTWAHPMTAFAAFGAGLALAAEALVRRRGTPLVRGLAVLVPAGLLSLACYAPVLGELLAARGLFSNEDASGPALLGPEGADALRQLGGVWALPPVASGGPPAALLAAPGWLALVLGLAVAVRTGRGWIALRWLAGLPLAFAVLGGLGTWIYARFTLFAVPGGLLAGCVGVTAVLAAAWPRRGIAAAAFAGVVLVLGLAWGADLRLRPERQPLRWAAEEARAEAGGGFGVVVIGLRHRVMEAYLGDLGPRLAHALDLGRDPAAVDRAFDAAEAGSSVEAIVVLYPDLVGPETYAALERRAPHLDFVRRRPGWIDRGRGAVEVRTRPPAPVTGAGR